MILGIYGSGGLGREVLENARQINSVSQKWEDIVFIDDYAETAERNGAKIFSFPKVKETYSTKTLEISVAVGEPSTRKKLYDKLEQEGYGLTAIVHPTAIVSGYSEIEPGVVVGAFSFISCNIKIGANSYIQPHVNIGHDCVLGKHTVISSNAILAGSCLLGDGVYIGMGVPVKEGTSIGEWTIIGMGSVVYNDIRENAIAIGNPARIMKNNDERKVFK
ncbi:GDP-perosamine N-acetyltransferase [Synergistales bacterium]|nr:GDP-perosamine N-acetyltransferase [Synergistales bacterium]